MKIEIYSKGCPVPHMIVSAPPSGSVDCAVHVDNATRLVSLLYDWLVVGVSIARANALVFTLGQ